MNPGTFLPKERQKLHTSKTPFSLTTKSMGSNFEIWIGAEQDNLSWEYLAMVRKDLVKFTKEFHKNPKPGGSKVKEAWRELYIAEGSDWNWWYEGKAHSGSDNPFDKLYLTHLKNVYKLLKKPVPGFLKISIA